MAASIWEAGVPHWPRAAIRWRANRRLRALVRIAAQSVPWYRERVATGGLDPGALRGVEHLDQWPVLPPDMLRHNAEQLLSDRVDRDECIKFQSSGTTGGQKTVYYDLKSFLHNAIYSSRGRLATYRVLGKLFGIRRVAIVVRNGTLDELGQLYRQAFGAPRYSPENRQLEILTPFDQKVERANRVKPDIVQGVAGAVADLYLEAHKQGVELHRPGLLKGTSEALTPATRRRLEQDCGIPVRLGYGSVESLKIGFQCEVGDGYHLHEDVCAVRIVGDDGQDLPEGDEGRVVITNLTNRATVLINYDQGGRGRVSSAPCPCGRRFKRLWLSLTRETPLLKTSTGRVVHYGEVLRPFITQPGFDALQVVVNTPDQWRIILNTEDDTHQAWHEDVEKHIQNITNNEVRVELNMNVPMEHTPGGKQASVIIRCVDQPPYAEDGDD